VSDAIFGLLNSLSSADFQFLTTTLPRPLQRPYLRHLEEPQRRPESAIQMAQLASALINNSFNSMYTMSGHSGTRSNNPAKLRVETLSSTMSYQAVVTGFMYPGYSYFTNRPPQLTKTSETSHRGYKRPAHRQDITSSRRSIMKGQGSGL
jgi:hypothetical protein